MTQEKTIFDVKAGPCGCAHEGEIDVVSAVKGCSRALCGLLITCAHGGHATKNFPHDGRAILRTSMKQHDIAEPRLDGLYELKGHLDVLRRRAYGRCYPMDATVAEMRKTLVFKSLTPDNPLTPLMKKIFHYAEHVPKVPEEIEVCNMIFFNADKLICDQINIILERVKDQVKVAAQSAILDTSLMV